MSCFFSLLLLSEGMTTSFMIACVMTAPLYGPQISPLPSKASNQTKIGLIRCFFKPVMTCLHETETGSDKILVASVSDIT